ncbi:histidine kinase [Nocardioides psychrotolerans]|uniref:PAS domain S-box-containing protein n=1 Tax=Nocardioides psychrotolerans TaxID=1005945 RepID=A0A1I3BR20_9ACTN|nr:PAS domain S-box protein [Nocardioides psychrotolerans]GEP36494.1 histidine kinase [Nocardioides psychrotolerans]SFH64747.1 PAS domain S-box-containing protein [Nocardioides psychrotolerans]
MSARPAWFGDRGVVGDIIEASPHNVIAVDADGAIAFVNARALRTFGYGEAELVGLPVEVLLPEDLDDRHRHHRANFAAHPVARPMGIGLEVLGRRRDGSTLPAEVSLTPVVTDRGSWILCSIADVTDRRATEDRLARVNRDYRTMAALNEAIVLAQDPPQLYAETCRIAIEEGGYLGAWAVRRTLDQGVETLATAGVLDDYIAHLDISLDPRSRRGNGPTATALRTGQAVYSSDFASDTITLPWHALAESFGIRSSATLPLAVGGRSVAALSLWSAEPRQFDERLRSQLTGLARNVSFALDGFVASARLNRLAQQRSDLLRRVVAAQEDERARIAADVHDESVQALAAVDLRLGLLARRVQEVAPELAPSVAQLQETVTSVTTGLRHLLFDLEAPDTQSSLDEALREAAGNLFEHSKVRWSVTVEHRGPGDEPSLQLSESVQVQALRIAKEALINVRKHAGASIVEVIVREVGDGIEVVLTDDGVGVGPAPAASAPGHRGVSTMRDRAELVGGWCRLEQAEPGTTVRFWVPREIPPVLLLTHQSHHD